MQKTTAPRVTHQTPGAGPTVRQAGSALYRLRDLQAIALEATRVVHRQSGSWIDRMFARGHLRLAVRAYAEALGEFLEE